MSRRTTPFVLILPAFLAVVAFTLYPSLYSIFLSFTNRTLVSTDYSFVGLQNYRELLGNPEFWTRLRITLVYVLTTIAGQLILGLCLALLTDKPRIGRRIVRTIVLMTWVIPEVVVSLTFKWMFLGDRYGLVNSVLLQTGIVHEAVKWLSQPNLTMAVAIGMTIWRGVSFSMIMQMAALQSVPRELYEVADIDGAGYAQKLFWITLPNIRSTILINLIIITIATFNVMSLVYVFSGGGPVSATEVISIYMYKSAFKFFRFGYASAISIVMFAINIIFTVAYVRIAKKDFIS